MAASRPVVLVFQEFATLSSTPATPELNCLVAGPAYWIQDFPEDRATIQLSLTPYGGTINKAATGSTVAPTAMVTDITIDDAPNNKVGAVLDTSSVRVFFGSPRAELANASDVTTTVGSSTVTSSATNFGNLGVAAGDYVILSDSTPHTLVKRVRSVSGLSITLTDEIPASGFTAGSSTDVRVERALADTEILSTFIGTTPSTNIITIIGGVTLDAGSGLGQKPITYADVYVAYRSLRQDLAALGTLSSITQINSILGRIDARNPLAGGLFTALQNTTSTLQYFGIVSDDLPGYVAMQAAISSRKDVYAIIPMTNDIEVIASISTENTNFADPDFAVANGTPQKFRVVVGTAGSLPTTGIIADKSLVGDTQLLTAATVSGHHTISFASGIDLITLGVKPGYKLSVDGTTYPYTVAQVNSATELEVDETGLSAGTLTSQSVRIKSPTGTVVTGGSVVTTDTTVPTADDDLYLDLYDTTATFVDDGAIPGDIIEMPKLVTDTGFTSVDRFIVSTVVSNQRLRIVNNGRNTSLVMNELPHGVTRTGTSVLVPSGATLTYHVVRTLDKDGQVSNLVAVAQSVRSRRAVLCWPDLVDVAGLVDGSLPRTTAAPATPVAAASQPGYYLACAVGGMTAALPSHQGFTNLGIAGITKIYDANTYFSDKQLSQISNGGWFVFQQDTPTALPYCIHQLTTDTSTLQFGEYSLVKNFDFVSLFFLDILNDFIGIWNINVETMGFIQQGIIAGISTLKLKKRARIGAPINSATLTSVAQSTVSEDRLEMYVEVDFPKPLNTVGLHLVST